MLTLTVQQHSSQSRRQVLFVSRLLEIDHPFTLNQVSVASGQARSPSTPLQSESNLSNHSTRKRTGNSLCEVLQLWLNLVIANFIVMRGLSNWYMGEFGQSKRFCYQLKVLCITNEQVTSGNRKKQTFKYALSGYKFTDESEWLKHGQTIDTDRKFSNTSLTTPLSITFICNYVYYYCCYYCYYYVFSH